MHRFARSLDLRNSRAGAEAREFALELISHFIPHLQNTRLSVFDPILGEVRARTDFVVNLKLDHKSRDFELHPRRRALAHSASEKKARRAHSVQSRVWTNALSTIYISDQVEYSVCRC